MTNFYGAQEMEGRKLRRKIWCDGWVVKAILGLCV